MTFSPNHIVVNSEIVISRDQIRAGFYDHKSLIFYPFILSEGRGQKFDRQRWQYRQGIPSSHTTRSGNNRLKITAR